MIQHRTNLPFAIDAAPPLDHTIMLSSSSPTSSATAFFGQHLRLDDSFESSVSSEFSSSSFSLKQRKSTRRMKNHKHNFNHHPHHHYHHHHHRNDFLFCGPNENGGFLANATSTPKQQQSTNMDLPPQHSSSGRPIIEFTLFDNKDNENNNNADNVIIPERLLVPLL